MAEEIKFIMVSFLGDCILSINYVGPKIDFELKFQVFFFKFQLKFKFYFILCKMISNNRVLNYHYFVNFNFLQLLPC